MNKMLQALVKHVPNNDLSAFNPPFIQYEVLSIDRPSSWKDKTVFIFIEIQSGNLILL